MVQMGGDRTLTTDRTRPSAGLSASGVRNRRVFVLAVSKLGLLGRDDLFITPDWRRALERSFALNAVCRLDILH